MSKQKMVFTIEVREDDIRVHSTHHLCFGQMERTTEGLPEPQTNQDEPYELGTGLTLDIVQALIEFIRND